MGRDWTWMGWAAGLIVAAVAATADAQTIKKETAPRIDSVEGADSYRAYCASCHGPAGKGDGPAAAALKTAPADLTTIARRHGGEFSSTDVEEVIAGRRTLASHGSREMPVWGPVFRALAPEDAARLRMHNLVSYIKSIQVR
jgi:mono/diheme cytochrome c family protein